jgi:hypothetical protein
MTEAHPTPIGTENLIPQLNVEPDQHTSRTDTPNQQLQLVPTGTEVVIEEIQIPLYERITEAVRELDAEEQAMIAEYRDAIATYIAIQFENRPKNNKSPNPIKKLPEAVVKHLIRDALKQNPWTPIKKLKLEIDGKKIKIPNDEFRTGKFKQWYNEILDEEVESYEKACEFRKQSGFKNQGGWGKIKKWHTRIIRDAFHKKPYTAGRKLIPSLSNYYDEKDKTSEYAQAYIEILKKYANESWENARELIFHPGFGAWGGWRLLKDKWIIKFLEEAYKQNPFNGSDSLDMTHKGRTVKTPSRFFFKEDRLKDLNKWIKQITTEYPDLNDEEDDNMPESMDRVIDLITRPNFRQLGGWNLIAPKWIKIIITQAIFQTEDLSTLANINYTHSDKREIPIKKIRRFYQSQKKEEEFDQIVETAKRLKKEIRTNTHEEDYFKPTTDGEPTLINLIQWAKHYPLEQQIPLWIRAEEGDKKAINELVRSTVHVLIPTAISIAKGDKTLVDELVSEGLELLENYASTFNYKRIGTNDIPITTFGGAVYKTLKRDLHIALKSITKGTSPRRIGTANKRHKARINETDTENYLQKFSITEISNLTGQGIDTILADLAIISDEVRIDGPIEEGEKETMHELLGATDQIFSTMEEAQIRDILRDIIAQLPPRLQIITKQYFQIDGIPNRSIEELQAIFPEIDVKEIATRGIAKLTKTLEAICQESKSFDPSILELIEKAINQKNLLKKLLEGTSPHSDEVKEKIKVVLAKATEILETPETIILTEMFDIPCTKKITRKEIADLSKYTRAAVSRSLIKTVYPKMKECLLRDHRLNNETLQQNP